jgi:hypothetical protein
VKAKDVEPARAAEALSWIRAVYAIERELSEKPLDATSRLAFFDAVLDQGREAAMLKKDTHVSTMDSEARLFKKGKAKKAKLCFRGGRHQATLASAPR